MQTTNSEFSVLTGILTINNILLLLRYFECYYNDDKDPLLLNKAFLKPSTFVSVLEGADKRSFPVNAASNQELPVYIRREWMHSLVPV